MSNMHTPLVTKTVAHVLFNIATGAVPKIPDAAQDLDVSGTQGAHHTHAPHRERLPLPPKN